MSRLFIFFFIVFSTSVSFAQPTTDSKRDFNWVFGPMTYPPPLYGTSVLNFNSSPPNSTFYEACLSLTVTNSSISDTNGRLLFYSNGMYVADSTHHRMPHGDSLNYGYFYNEVNDSFSGYNNIQGLLILPVPDNPTQYYIIHEPLILDPNYYSNVRTDGLYYTKVDMTLHNGLGDVVENQKNIPILQDTLEWGLISAVRHGNGRDWWIIVAEAFTNCFYRILLTPNGFINYGLQCVGYSHKPGVGQVVFSPDGSLYARCIDTVFLNPPYIDVFSFDRCEGTLSEVRRFSASLYSYWRGISISPNSRYLFYSDLVNLYQYDLNSFNFGTTQQLIASYDSSFHDPFNQLVLFSQQQLGPDGKIYILGGDTQFFSVINQPDSFGISCDFEQHSLVVPTICWWAMPNIPNFRLGKLPGSACDTLVVSVTNPQLLKNKLKVYPNPASDVVTFSIDVDNNNYPMELDIYNALSQKIRVLTISPYQGMVRLDIKDVAPGMYVAILQKGNERVSTCKFSVSR